LELAIVCKGHTKKQRDDGSVYTGSPAIRLSCRGHSNYQIGVNRTKSEVRIIKIRTVL